MHKALHYCSAAERFKKKKKKGKKAPILSCPLIQLIPFEVHLGNAEMMRCQCCTSLSSAHHIGSSGKEKPGILYLQCENIVILILILILSRFRVPRISGSFQD